MGHEIERGNCSCGNGIESLFGAGGVAALGFIGIAVAQQGAQTTAPAVTDFVLRNTAGTPADSQAGSWLSYTARLRARRDTVR